MKKKKPFFRQGWGWEWVNGKAELLLVANGPWIPGTPVAVGDTGIFLNFWGYRDALCHPCLNLFALTKCSVASVAC